MLATVRTFGLAACALAALPAGASAQARLTADGTEFVLTLPDGRTLRSAALQGATLKMRAAPGEGAVPGGSTVTDVTIVSVEEDPDAVGGRVLLHHFVTRDADGSTADLCLLDPEGKSLGFPVPDGRGSFELTCTSGAIGKCIRWGYRPWDERPGGAPLGALHRACVHMARADYGGDGRTGTRDGTAVHICDRFGVRPCVSDAPLAFEAAWGEHGATCVAHPRIPDLLSLDDIAKRVPRLEGSLGPAACTEASAARDPATLIFNRS
jgi:hypothetical protein